jgi:hypothetical protein
MLQKKRIDENNCEENFGIQKALKLEENPEFQV